MWHIRLSVPAVATEKKCLVRLVCNGTPETATGFFPFTAAQTRTVYAHDMTAYSAAHARHTVPTSLASVDARGGPWGDGSLLGAILDPQNEMFTGGDGS